MNLFPFFNLLRYEKTEAIKDIIETATPRPEFYLLSSIAVSVAVAGLFTDNMPLIISSMLIAPLLFPLFAASMGLVTRNWKLLRRSLVTILGTTAIGLFIAVVAAWFYRASGFSRPVEGYLFEIQPTVTLFVISFLSGIAAATAVTNQKLNDVLPGIAISVALIPPLTATGIHVAFGYWQAALGTMLLYVGSVLLVFVSSSYVFHRMEFQTQKRQAEREQDQEEKKSKERAKNAEQKN